MQIINQAVGPGCPNLRDDVLLVQGLLRQDFFESVAQSSSRLPPLPEVNGKFDAPTAAALDWFLQRENGTDSSRQVNFASMLPMAESSPILGGNLGLSVRNYTPTTGGLKLEPVTNWAWMRLSRFMELPVSRGGSGALSDADVTAAAEALKCELAAIKAVSDVEARGSGWLPDGRPKILFEAHIFSKYTTPPHGLDAVLPDISCRKWNKTLYGEGGAHQYDRLEKAMAFDRLAALKAASYGRFQIMGFNHKAAGFSSVENMVESMFTSERRHLDAFVQFLVTSHLDKPLQKKNWAAFALGYNGSKYAVNQYDTKLEAAYKKHSKMP